MPKPPKPSLQPRKSPLQARSTASVEAILEATIQVLLDVGKERLTTTRVAHRAGVSVGTLYQYFPNKSALLQAVLKRHLEDVVAAIESASISQRGQSLSQMATGLIAAFLVAKFKSVHVSEALYSVSDDVDGKQIVRQTGSRSIKAVAAMLQTAKEPLATDPHLAASTLLSAIFGISRRMLESSLSKKQLEAVKHELIVLATAYLNACAQPSRYSPQ